MEDFQDNYGRFEQVKHKKLKWKSWLLEPACLDQDVVLWATYTGPEQSRSQAPRRASGSCLSMWHPWGCPYFPAPEERRLLTLGQPHGLWLDRLWRWMDTFEQTSDSQLGPGKSSQTCQATWCPIFLCALWPMVDNLNSCGMYLTVPKKAAIRLRFIWSTPAWFAKSWQMHQPILYQPAFCRWLKQWGQEKRESDDKYTKS